MYNVKNKGIVKIINYGALKNTYIVSTKFKRDN